MTKRSLVDVAVGFISGIVLWVVLRFLLIWLWLITDWLIFLMIFIATYICLLSYRKHHGADLKNLAASSGLFLLGFVISYWPAYLLIRDVFFPLALEVIG